MEQRYAVAAEMTEVVPEINEPVMLCHKSTKRTRYFKTISGAKCSLTDLEKKTGPVNRVVKFFLIKDCKEGRFILERRPATKEWMARG